MLEVMEKEFNAVEMWIKAIFIACVGLLAPVHSIMIVTGCLVVGDTVTGIWASKKKGEVITSSKYRRTISKMFIYYTVIILGFLVETIMLGGTVPVAKITAAAIGTTELLSVLENASVILEHNIFDSLKKALGSDNDKDSKKKGKK